MRKVACCKNGHNELIKHMGRLFVKLYYMAIRSCLGTQVSSSLNSLRFVCIRCLVSEAAVVLGSRDASRCGSWALTVDVLRKYAKYQTIMLHSNDARPRKALRSWRSSEVSKLDRTCWSPLANEEMSGHLKVDASSNSCCSRLVLLQLREQVLQVPIKWQMQFRDFEA